MRASFSRFLFAAGFAASTAACGGFPSIVCQTDRLCTNTDGTNEIYGICLDSPSHVKYCAFPATDCASMWRWSRLSGDYSEQCVDPALIPPDAGMDGGADAATDR